MSELTMLRQIGSDRGINMQIEARVPETPMEYYVIHAIKPGLAEVTKREKIHQRLQAGESGIGAAHDISEACGHPGITITMDHPLAGCFNAASENETEVKDAKLLASGGSIALGWNNGYVIRTQKRNQGK